MPIRAISFILVSYIALHAVLGTPVQVLELDDTTCSHEVYVLSEHDSFQVEWKGRQLPSNCKLSFISSDGYKVCAEAWNHDVRGCGLFIMKYYNGQGSTVPVESFACHATTNVPTVCTTEDTHLIITFETTAPATSYQSPPSVLVSITAKAPKDEKHTEIAYLVVPIAANVCMVVVGVVVFMVYRKRRQQRRLGMTMQMD